LLIAAPYNTTSGDAGGAVYAIYAGD
jgi:hypothetical protein